MKSRIVRLLHTKSASDFHGRKVHHEKEYLFNYASSAMSLSPAFSNILQLLHLDRLINFLATYQVVPSTLFSSRTLSTISHVLCLPLQWHTPDFQMRSSSQKLIFSLSKERYCKILLVLQKSLGRRANWQETYSHSFTCTRKNVFNWTILQSSSYHVLMISLIQ